jgi:CheY-like chemotaxis protein
MSNFRRTILIVDDNDALRMTLSLIFGEAGYEVRVAADGFSALGEIRQEAPNVLLSDLNMPGMSGFELLSVVRRRFPGIRVIAMSGAFSGEVVPQGVAADAFYQKGRTSVERLLQLADEMIGSKQPLVRRSLVPIWIPGTPLNPHGDAYVVITCPECLRVFPQALEEEGCSTDETSCLHCSSMIRFALVRPTLETDMTGLAIAG